MNVLELLQAHLRRASAGAGYDPALLSEVEGEASLPPRDPQVLAPGQEIGGLAAARGMGGGLHSNALGIYAAPRPPPPGDVVLPSGDRGLAIPWMPRPSGDSAGRAGNVMTTPSYLPGPYGSTRIAMRGPPGAVPSPSGGNPVNNSAIAAEMLERMRRDPSLIGSMNRMQGTPAAPQTTFSETDRIPPEAAGRGYQTLGQPLFDQELMARLFGPQRHQQLFDDIQQGREFTREGVWPMPEGEVQSMSPNSPYSSPLNQMLRRGPFGQY